MKKVISYIITLVMVVLLAACGAGNNETPADTIGTTSFSDAVYEVNGQQVELEFYGIEDAFILELSEQYGDGTRFAVYGTDELMAEILEHRTEGDEIIIERCIGIVTNTDRAGDGKILNTNDDYYNYISYSGVDFETHDGTIILSYFIYNPGTDYTDDIMERYDFVLSREYED